MPLPDDRECAVVAPAAQSEWPNLRDPKTMYEKHCSTEEMKQWEKREVTQDYDGIWSTERKPTLPKRYLICVVGWFHNKVSGEAEATARQVNKNKKWGAPEIYAAAKRITASFPAYQKFSSIRQSSELG